MSTLRITPERAAEIAALLDALRDRLTRRRAVDLGYVNVENMGELATIASDLLADRAVLLAEVERLRAVVAGLPHAPGCGNRQPSSVECDCGACRDPHAPWSTIPRSMCDAPHHYSHATTCAVAMPPPCSCGKDAP